MQRTLDVVHAIFCIADLGFLPGSFAARHLGQSSSLLGHGLDLLERRPGGSQMVLRPLRAFPHSLGKGNCLSISNVLREPKIDIDDVFRAHIGPTASVVPGRLTLAGRATVPANLAICGRVRQPMAGILGNIIH